MERFRSNAEEIKFYIKQLLDDGQPKSIREIIQYVKEKSGKDFTSGMLSGAVNDLIDREREYQRVSRGVYAKRVSSPDNEPEAVFNAIIQKSIAEVENARHVDIANLTPEHLEKIQKRYRKIITSLHALLEEQ